MIRLLLTLIFLLSASVASAKDLIIVGATWCSPCMQLKNFIKSNENQIKFNIVQIDIDKDKETARKLKVTKVPSSFIFDDDGKLLSKKIGYSSSSYKKWLEANE
jgi:thioredoxin-like negative regulator of GroEL